MTLTLDHLEIFFGDANNAAARVYARLAADGLPPGCTLTGRVVGPSCQYSHTLVASIPLAAKREAVSSGSSSALLAEAIVPDPCFWSGDLPFLYQAHVELRCGGQTLAAEERMFGIRPLGAHQRRLVREGRSWVVRGADRRELPERAMSQWRAADLAMYVERPDDETCGEASRHGVVLIAELAGDGSSLAEELKRLARWPAVVIAALPDAGRRGSAIRGAAPNLLLAGSLKPDDSALPRDWADLIICEASSSPDAIARQAAATALPVFVHRAAGWRDDLADARRACDNLQRDLAGRGEFAGYLV